MQSQMQVNFVTQLNLSSWAPTKFQSVDLISAVVKFANTIEWSQLDGGLSVPELTKKPG